MRLNLASHARPVDNDTMMRTTAVKMLFMLVLNQEIKLTSSFSLEMAAFCLCLPRTEREQNAIAVGGNTQNAIVDGSTSF